MDFKKNEIKPHLKRQWCLSKIESPFICQMENILDFYEKDYDPDFPLVCFDERPCQLIEDILVPTPTCPGREKREDYHYKRNGTCAVFLVVEPKRGTRIVEVSERKTKEDYTRFMKKVNEAYKGAKKIRLVQDNLNTHNASSFYENLKAEEAFDLMRRFEMIYTPKKASWLNMAEIEFSALSKQCLDRRIGEIKKMRKEVKAWAEERNQKRIKIHWQFTKDQARVKFEKRYLNIEN